MNERVGYTAEHPKFADAVSESENCDAHGVEHEESPDCEPMRLVMCNGCDEWMYYSKAIGRGPALDFHVRHLECKEQI